jgi:hypothetical protein
MTDQTSREERIYRNTVRALYLFALAANAVIIWGQVKDTPEGIVLRTRTKQLGRTITKPYRERQWFIKEKNKVIFEAVTVVEEAKGTDNAHE